MAWVKLDDGLRAVQLPKGQDPVRRVERAASMRVIEVEKRETKLQRKEFTNNSGWESDELLRGDTLVIDKASGDPALLQIGLPAEDTARLRRLVLDAVASRQLWDNVGERMSGITYQFATFGYKQRSPLRRRDCCSASLVNRTQPALYAELERFTSDVILPRFAEWLPGPHARQMEACEAIRPEWRIGGDAPWTSGIINNTAQLQYHRDSRNITGSWSAMLALRQFVRGGHLHVPEYGATCEVADGQLIFFCGSNLLHGVTPFSIRQFEKPRSYRYTIVWYPGAGMSTCLPWEEELAYGKRARTVREERAGGR